MTAGQLRICIVNPSLQGGGAEHQIALLMPKLRDAGFEVFYLAHHITRPGGDGYSIVRIGRSTGIPKIGYTADLLPLYAALRRLRPQVIYQRVGCAYTGICALYARSNATPLIWHVSHDTDVMPSGLDTGRNFIRRRLEKCSIEYGLRHADHIVMQTSQQQDLLCRNYGRSGGVSVIPNFDREPQEKIDKSGPPTVIWIANLKPWKRPEAFVRLADSLRDIPDVRFLMFGEPPRAARPPRWWSEVRASMTQLPNLQFMGPVSVDAVKEQLARALVFVNTSLFEGFPNTFIQAWMRDTVVVSLDVDPDGVLARDSMGIRAGSESALASAVRHLLTDSSARNAYVARARSYVRAWHSMRNADQLVELLRACAEPAAARHPAIHPG